MLASLVLAASLVQAAVPVPQTGSPGTQEAQAPWPPAGVVRPGPGLTPPRVVTDVKPTYTADAMRAGIEGEVSLEAVVEADGTVGDVRVVGPLDPGLDAEAVRALRRWRFEPGRRDGTAVRVLVDVQMTFRLRDRDGGPPTPVEAAAGSTGQPSAPWPPEGVVRMGPGIVAPRLLQDRKPEYTAAAMRQGIEGSVSIEAVVQADGRVGEVRVTRSLDATFGLDNEAVRAMRQWRFVPGMRDGAPVPVLVEIEMSFAMRK